MTDVTAFIVAGGKSSRMGEDKAFVQFHGKHLLEHMLSIARLVTDSVLIVGAPQKYAAYAPTLPDVFRDRGPLGGIHAGLRHTPTDLNLVLAIDMPFVSPEFLLRLVSVARTTPALVTVPQAGGRFQPLCAVYRKTFADMAERALASGRNKIDRLFTPDATRIVTEEEIERLAFPVSMFDNLNTREDVKRAQEHNVQR